MKLHAKKNEFGQDVIIHKPSLITPFRNWYDPSSYVTVIPDSRVPEELNFVPVIPLDNPPTDWNTLDQGQFSEPELTKITATGTIIIEDDDRVWLISPTNEFGGYITTLGPKGKIDKGLSGRANALKETYEESGLLVKLVGYAFDAIKTTSVTRYYFAKRIKGSPADMGWETQAVHLVPRNQIRNFLNTKIDLELGEMHAIF